MDGFVAEFRRRDDDCSNCLPWGDIKHILEIVSVDKGNGVKGVVVSLSHSEQVDFGTAMTTLFETNGRIDKVNKLHIFFILRDRL